MLKITKEISDRKSNTNNAKYELSEILSELENLIDKATEESSEENPLNKINILLEETLKNKTKEMLEKYLYRLLKKPKNLLEKYLFAIESYFCEY